jgi:hypothetical protein
MQCRHGAWKRYFVRARSESDLAGRRDTETRTPQVFYLFVVETLNMGFDMATMYQPLVLQYGVSLRFVSDYLIPMRTDHWQASN